MQVYPLCKEKNMNVKSMSYTGKVLWTVWELDVEDYEILFMKKLCDNDRTIENLMTAKTYDNHM